VEDDMYVVKALQQVFVLQQQHLQQYCGCQNSEHYNLSNDCQKISCTRSRHWYYLV